MYWDSVDNLLVQAQLSVAAAAPTTLTGSRPAAMQIQGRTSNSGGSGRRSVCPDIALVCRASIQSATKRQRTQQSRTIQKQRICVCEVKIVLKMSQGDLVALFNAGDKNVVCILKQMFSYMVAMQLEYGIISCYELTVLVWRPLDEPNKILVSRTYAAMAEDPEVTAMAAMAWLQDRAVQQILGCGKRHQPYSAASLSPALGDAPSPSPSSPGNDDGQGGDPSLPGSSRGRGSSGGRGSSRGRGSNRGRGSSRGRGHRGRNALESQRTIEGSEATHDLR